MKIDLHVGAVGRASGLVDSESCTARFDDQFVICAIIPELEISQGIASLHLSLLNTLDLTASEI